MHLFKSFVINIVRKYLEISCIFFLSVFLTLIQIAKLGCNLHTQQVSLGH